MNTIPKEKPDKPKRGLTSAGYAPRTKAQMSIPTFEPEDDKPNRFLVGGPTEMLMRRLYPEEF